MRIGILALQGAFAEHRMILEKLGAESFEIRQKRDLEQPMDGLIIPGGESTVMGKLLKNWTVMTKFAAASRTVCRYSAPVPV